MTPSRKTDVLGATLRRGFIIAGTLVAALTVQAQQIEQIKSSDHTSGRGDVASCLKEAAQMNAATIKFGELASQKAQNADLKTFGEQVEKDHKKAQVKLEAIAKKHDVMLPTSLDAKCQAEISRLQGLSGTEFDKEFAKSALQGHAMAIANLEKASVQAKDPDLTQYNKNMLVQLKRHQERARDVAKIVGLDQATIAALETQPPEGVGTSGVSSQSESGTVSPQLEQKNPKDAPRQP